MRLLAVFTMGLADTAAAVALGTRGGGGWCGIGCGLAVCAAAGWAAAQHDEHYRRVRGLDGT